MNAVARRAERACRIAELLRLTDRCRTQHRSSATAFRRPVVRLGGERPTLATVVVTRRDTEHMPTAAFLRAVSAVLEPGTPSAPGDPLRSADHGRHSDQAQSDTR
jgi:hypothetical protein